MRISAAYAGLRSSRRRAAVDADLATDYDPARQMNTIIAPIVRCCAARQC
jgi:hypothetical protein